MNGKYLKNRGFTMIEIMIVVVIIAIFLGGVVAFGASIYKQYIKTSRQAEMKVDVANIRAMIQGDIQRGGKASINPENHGITITKNGKKNVYALKDGAIYRESQGRARKLTRFPVKDAVWTYQHGLVTMNIVYNFRNINKRKLECFKVIKDIEMSTEEGDTI